MDFWFLKGLWCFVGGRVKQIFLDFIKRVDKG